MKQIVWGILACCLLAAPARMVAQDHDLEQSFRNPPQSAQAWTYWWWLNGCVTKDGIVRDLDHMKAKGISGALVFHAGQGETPFQVEFMSQPWRELFKFAVREAAKRNIVIGFNVCGGWNAGGPWVKPEEAAQTLDFKAVAVRGGKRVAVKLPAPKPARGEYYEDIAVLAWRFTAPGKGQPAVCRRATMVDLSGKLQGDELTWDAPAGHWVVIRFGHHLDPRAHTKCMGGKSYLELDPLRAGAMDRHFEATAGVLVEDVKEYVGKTFQYVHIDSGEIGKPDWTPAFREEFKKRRGYDPYPYMAARAQMQIDDAEITTRFNEDYERTLGDLMVENYYGRLGVLARRHGLGTHSEAAGFQKPWVDALASLGVNDICMSEFWAHRSNDPSIHQLQENQLRNHDGIKTAAAAAHTYGRKIVQAEAFTFMSGGFPNYFNDPFSLKAVGDRAFCAGLNRNMLCFMVSQPDENAKPGYEWPKVGNEFNRHVTWWTMGGAWLAYLARCQMLLQAGQFVADACYFDGEWAPHYVPARWAMSPDLPRGYDCDTVNAAVLCGGAEAKGGRLKLASGMEYSYLVFGQGGPWQHAPGLTIGRRIRPRGAAPEDRVRAAQPLAVTPATLKKIKELVEAGLTLVGPPPARSIGLTNYPEDDKKVSQLAATLWGTERSAAGERKVGQGRVIWGKTLAQVFQSDGLSPDLEIREDAASAALTTATLNGIPNPYGSFDWIHRRAGGAEVYFIANLRSVGAGGEFTFRVKGRRPELWDAVTGQMRVLPEHAATGDGRTVVPLRFAPCQSFFVIFRSAEDQVPNSKGQTSNAQARNFPASRKIAAIEGAWEVAFDPQWGGPQRVSFERLVDWTQRPEEGVRHYAGTAVYRKTFSLSQSDQSQIYLDLGEVKNLARVRLNGQDLGVVWTAPWRVEITPAVKAGDNTLEIEVVNLWPNRLIGDAGLPAEKRFTVTNIPGLKADAALFPSGLLGPVTILAAGGTEERRESSSTARSIQYGGGIP